MKEAKWTLASGKEIDFFDIFKKANVIKRIKCEFAGNEFIADAKNGELIVNGQRNKFGSGLPNPFSKKIKYKIDCIRRTQETYIAGTTKKVGKKVFYLIGLIMTVGEDEHVRYIIAIDPGKEKHEFQIVSHK